jgi:hypothetical protein
MTAALYKHFDGCEVTIKQLSDACSEACSTLSGAMLILRVFDDWPKSDDASLTRVRNIELFDMNELWPEDGEDDESCDSWESAFSQEDITEESCTSTNDGRKGGCDGQAKPSQNGC